MAGEREQGDADLLAHEHLYKRILVILFYIIFEFQKSSYFIITQSHLSANDFITEIGDCPSERRRTKFSDPVLQIILANDYVGITTYKRFMGDSVRENGDKEIEDCQKQEKKWNYNDSLFHINLVD